MLCEEVVGVLNCSCNCCGDSVNLHRPRPHDQLLHTPTCSLGLKSIPAKQTRVQTAATLARTLTMAHPGFGHLWQQAEMSDVEIVISVAEGTVSAGDETTEAQNSTRTILQQFPGHSPILSLSPYFVAQASIENLLSCLACITCWSMLLLPAAGVLST